MKLIHTIMLMMPAICLTLASCGQKKAPSITNESAIEVSPTVVLVEADITGDDLSQYGVCFSNTNQEPTWENCEFAEGSLQADHFQARVILMDSGKTYYFRVFAINDQGTAYSSSMKVTISYQDVGANDNGYPVVR